MMWREALTHAPSHVEFIRPQEHYDLAQASFLAGQMPLSHEQITLYIQEMTASGNPIPSNAWCLKADTLDALGRHAESQQASIPCTLPDTPIPEQ